MFQELVYTYQNSVLAADQEVEDGLVNFLKADQKRQLFWNGVIYLIDANRYMTHQLAKGQIDVNRYSTIAQNLVTSEVSWASAAEVRSRRD